MNTTRNECWVVGSLVMVLGSSLVAVSLEPLVPVLVPVLGRRSLSMPLVLVPGPVVPIPGSGYDAEKHPIQVVSDGAAKTF